MTQSHNILIRNPYFETYRNIMEFDSKREDLSNISHFELSLNYYNIPEILAIPVYFKT